MISVSVCINGRALFVRSARKITDNADDEMNQYKVDTGQIIEHVPNEGAVELSNKLLATIDDRDIWE